MKKLLPLLLVAMLVSLCGIQRCYSLTIIREFLGGTPPTNSIGTGTLEDIFNAACDVWELAIRDEMTITLRYGWTNCGGGQHTLISQCGTPNRETEGLIEFNNDNEPGHFSLDIDYSPLVMSTSTNVVFNEQSVDLGVGMIVASRYYSWTTTNQQMDLFTVALHEIGHALGMGLGNYSFINESADSFIDITTGDYMGMSIPLQHNNFGVTSHISYIADRTLMSGSFAPGERVMPSPLDLVALAQLSGFTELNPNLAPVLTTTALPQVKTLVPGSPGMRISWIQPLPAPAGTRYVLESSTDLAGSSWSTVTDTVSVVNGRYSVDVPMTSAHEFFRLVSK